jgi:signal transduction histidine kinase/CheY-like chemotaxis protein
VFPAYIETDEALKVAAVGPSLSRLAGDALIGADISDQLVFTRPAGALTVEDWAVHAQDLEARLNVTGLRLRGLVLKLDGGFLFCLSHAATRPEELLDRGLRMGDFSPADGGLALALALGVQDELLIETRALISEVAQARDDALAGLRAKSAFLANMSHEIRTPLNGVTGIAGALARTKLNADQKRLVSVIQSAGRTLERLLSDVLEVSLAESGRLSLRKTPVDLQAAVQEVLYPLKLEAEDKGLVFDLEFDLAGHEQVVTDETRLKQILACLASNAVKFTATGKVSVTVTVESDPDLDLTLQISVADSGVGFDMARLQDLYAPFSQQSHRGRDETDGLGLGLSIAKSMSDLMGGRIEATSRLDEGSVFLVSLPVDAPPRSERPPATHAEAGLVSANIEHLKVLLAEDHPTNQTVVRLILEPHDVKLTIAPDGLEALERFKSARFDLILMDLRMPGLNGLELTGAIRSLELETGQERTPIVIVSADALPEHRLAALQAGADHYLAKPITPESLFEAMDHVLSGAESAFEL